MEKTLHLEYKNRKFALHPFSPESRLIVIDEDSKKAVLECNFPTRNQHTIEILRFGLDEDAELLGEVKRIICLWVDQGRL